jgi:DHA3 family tetracycline resistance protein-like MFS transporter
MKRPSAAALFYGLEFTLSLPSYVLVAVYLVTEVGLSPLQLVLVGTVMEVAVFLFEVPTGVVADTYGRKLSLIVSFVIQGAAWMLVGAVPSFWVILLAWALWGFGETFMSGAYEAWITDEVGADRVGPILLRGTRISYLGALAGLGLGVAIAAYDLRLAIVLGGAVVVAAGLACIVVMPETGFQPRPREVGRPPVRELAATARDGARFARGRPLVLLLLSVGLFVGASSESFDRLWEAHFIRDIGLPALGSLEPIWWFGLFGAGMLLAGLVASTVMIRRFERASNPALARTLFVLTFVEVVGFIAFGLARGIALAVTALLVTQLARSLVRPVYMTWLNQQITDSSVRATVISIAGQADAVGEAGGGPLLGAVGNAFGIRAALVAGGAVLSPALLLYGRAIRHHGREPELDEASAPAPI